MLQYCYKNIKRCYNCMTLVLHDGLNRKAKRTATFYIK